MVLDFLKNIFRKENLRDSIQRLNNDVSLLKQWILHLNYKNKEITHSHKNYVSLTREDIGNINKWISYLNKHLTEISKSMRKLEQENKKLTQKLECLQQPEITSRNHDVTKNDTENDMQNNISHQIDYNYPNVSLSSSERKIIMLLFSSEKPLSYTQLSQKSGLNYGTVKNIIYKIRKKGLEIKSMLNQEGEKEFFLTSKMRIQLSGR